MYAKLFFFSILLVVLSINTGKTQNKLSIHENQILMNGEPFQAIGLRCSNALINDEAVTSLIAHLDEYKNYGLNTISVYFMGSRYSNVNGYNLDGSIKAAYADRMASIIKACEQREMVVLVRILYWGAQMGAEENAYYQSWKQAEVNSAIVNTINWIQENNFQNVFIDPDNEGMAERGAGFDIAEMICAGKQANPEIMIAYNGKSYPPPCADLPVHFGWKVDKMPYIQTEGTPDQYWGEYSKERRLDHYINVGIYTKGKKVQQIAETRELLEQGHGYLFASTWLQNVPPNYDLGGNGSPCDPGMRWWLEFVKDWLERNNN